MKVGNKLKNLRQKNAFSQKEIANLLNVSQSTYSKYENDKIALPIRILCKLADIYGKTTEEILLRHKKRHKII